MTADRPPLEALPVALVSWRSRRDRCSRAWRYHPQQIATGAARRSRLARWALVLTVMPVFAAVIAAFLIRLPIVESAPGMVVPTGSIKEIRSTLSGIVDRLAVEEGDVVRPGDLLLALDRREINAQIAATRLALDHLRLERAKIDALVSAFRSGDRQAVIDIAAPVPVPHRLLDDYRQQLRAELAATFAEFDTLSARHDQLTARIATLESERATLVELDPIVDERLQTREFLADRGSGTRREALSAREAWIRHEGQREAVGRRMLEAGEERRRIARERDQFMAQRIAGLIERRRQLTREIGDREAELSERLARRDRLVLRAPVAAVVEQLEVAGQGVNVIEEERLMTLVPLEEQMIVEAFVANTAIAFVATGQTAVLKLDTLPFQRYGTVRGEVVSVGATSVQQVTGDWRYPVRISVPGEARTSVGVEAVLRPGMTLHADILTEDRTLASYFLDIVTKAADEGMREQ